MVGHSPLSKPSWQKKPALTHFLCLPLVTETSRPHLDRSLKLFSNEVCSGISGDHIDQKKHDPTAGVQSPEPLPTKAIRPVGTLHLTLGVMTLNQDQLAKAVQMLSSLDVAALLRASPKQASSPNTANDQELALTPLNIELKGLESMHDPESTSILYVAPSDPTERLHNFCLALRKQFGDFLVPDDRPLRLHATIVNTIYAKSKKSASRSQGHGPKAKGCSKFDARTILHKYQDFVWAENCILDRIAICEMGAKKVMDAAKVRVLDEQYTEVVCATLPS